MKMYCVKNRIYCHDCTRSFVDNNYSNHLRSQGDIDNVMKKHCCSCVSKISLKSDVGIQTDFREKLDTVIDAELNMLVEKFKSFWDKPFKTENDFDEVEIILDEFLRIKAITIKQYNIIRQKSDFQKRLQSLKKLK